MQAITGGAEEGVASWIGSMFICGVVFVYVTYGGMRSTAWANTFQTLLVIGNERATHIRMFSFLFLPFSVGPFRIFSVTGCRRVRPARSATASSSIPFTLRRWGFPA